ncbi:MAG TPA: 1,4-alpha-glucan branching protein GlgB [Gammaproteobacteria bacterium]|nr:1,4-alpha-glucan branching protein GlgB [Gammaproteobacteria bacterium]
MNTSSETKSARTRDIIAPSDLVHAVLSGDCRDPFAVLGLVETSGGLCARTFQPDAERAWLLDGENAFRPIELERVHDAGFFAAALGSRARFPYRWRLEAAGSQWEVEDPYRFPHVLGELDAHLILEGNHLGAYERMGAHPRELDGVAGVSFAVWAPHARRVSVVGDFNRWDGRRHPMRNRDGIWEIFLPQVERGQRYKYEIVGADGTLLPLKSDPFAFRTERAPQTASIVHGLPQHDWQDAAWMAERERHNVREAPIAVYECHLGSWMRGDGNRYLSYGELGERLVPYLKRTGFTHVELLPVTEHPFDGSWGYQPIGLYAPTSRFGGPEDFAAFVDTCHASGIGVILDWVPGHFPTDTHGLGYFDGSHLYEHADPRQGFHQDWNTLIFNYGRREVANYLLANALFWLERYHLDALRVDAVASMLYLDYSREDGAWVPNRFGGRENLEAIEFLKRMNELLFARAPGATSFAEESTAWPGVSRPVYLGGLGFGYKWNMGWMNDILRYMQQDPIHRRYHHDKITFSMLYAFTENFVLPFSHDEVVHLKGSMIGKMPGDEWQKFANLRLLYGYMFGHPGKKLLFMGCEFGVVPEWNHEHSLEWHVLEYPLHRGMQTWVRDLNRLYRSEPAMHQIDFDYSGFEWIDCQDSQASVMSFLRHGRRPEDTLVFVCNFTPVPRYGYRIGVPHGGYWREILNSDASLYNGSNQGNDGGAQAWDEPMHGRPHCLSLTVPPLATVVFKRAG